MFVQSYSYNWLFYGSHNVDVALSENEFDPPELETTTGRFVTSNFGCFILMSEGYMT